MTSWQQAYFQAVPDKLGYVKTQYVEAEIQKV